MSQHKFITTYNRLPVEVLMGWDRALQGYFLTVLLITPLYDEDLDEDYYTVFDNFQFLPTLTPWMDKLAELGIAIPHEMAQQVYLDGLTNAGNLDKDWSAWNASPIVETRNLIASLEQAHTS